MSFYMNCYNSLHVTCLSAVVFSVPLGKFDNLLFIIHQPGCVPVQTTKTILNCSKAQQDKYNKDKDWDTV